MKLLVDRTIVAIDAAELFEDNKRGEQPTACDSPPATLTLSYGKRATKMQPDQLNELLQKVLAFWRAEGFAVDDSELDLDDPAIYASGDDFTLSFHIIPMTGIGQLVGSTTCLPDGET